MQAELVLLFLCMQQERYAWDELTHVQQTCKQACMHGCAMTCSAGRVETEVTYKNKYKVKLTTDSLTVSGLPSGQSSTVITRRKDEGAWERVSACFQDRQAKQVLV